MNRDTANAPANPSQNLKNGPVCAEMIGLTPVRIFPCSSCLKGLVSLPRVEKHPYWELLYFRFPAQEVGQFKGEERRWQVEFFLEGGFLLVQVEGVGWEFLWADSLLELRWGVSQGLQWGMVSHFDAFCSDVRSSLSRSRGAPMAFQRMLG